MLKNSSEKSICNLEKRRQNAFASPALRRKSFKNICFKWRQIISLPRSALFRTRGLRSNFVSIFVVPPGLPTLRSNKLGSSQKIYDSSPL